MRIGIENCPMYFTGDEWPGVNLYRPGDLATRSTTSAAMPSVSTMILALCAAALDPASPLKEFQDKIFHFHAKDVKSAAIASTRWGSPIRWSGINRASRDTANGWGDVYGRVDGDDLPRSRVH